MIPDDDFVENAWALVKEDSCYLLYLKNGGTTSIQLPEGYYDIKWFNSRIGGDLLEGTIRQIITDSISSIGLPPYDENKDWACLITRTDSISTDLREGKLIPKSIYLKPNFPNPFNPSTTINFGLNTTSEIHLSIYNIAGQLIKNLLSDSFKAGDYSIDWDGTNIHGDRVSSGIYLCSLITSKFEITNKMILSK